jgi:hypothetical protein
VRGEGITPAESRDLMRYAEAYSPRADELEALGRFSVNAARNAAGSEALTVYALAQRLAKRREHAGLAPYVADMRRARNAISAERVDVVDALLDAGVDPRKEPYNVRALASGNREIAAALRKKRN